ncbi:MAG: Crp/Fnr family transcriptional regulator, partial [Spirochaetales bacterium]|nr:Crp/Fnr family transcriptional regulator [Spirochaetales bacterium]
MSDYIIKLQHCSLFYGLESDSIEELLEEMNYSVKFFHRFEDIFTPLMKAENIGIILSGEVLIQKYISAEKLISLGIKRAPDVLAAPALFSGEIFYPCASHAHTDVELLTISKSTLKALFEREPKVSLNYISTISREMIKLKNKISLLSKSSLREKIAYYLLNLAKCHSSHIIELDMSKKELAYALNVTRTSLSREIQNLQNERIILNKNRKIE